MTIQIKLPPNIINIHLPPITTTQQTNTGAIGIRGTHGGNRRVTRGGNRRVTRGVVHSYPELAAVKLPSNVITVSIPNR